MIYSYSSRSIMKYPSHFLSLESITSLDLEVYHPLEIVQNPLSIHSYQDHNNCPFKDYPSISTT